MYHNTIDHPCKTLLFLHGKLDKKAYKTIKKIGQKERRITSNILHKISRALVNEALENNSMIVLGNHFKAGYRLYAYSRGCLDIA
jgi:hypothetical protein